MDPNPFDFPYADDSFLDDSAWNQVNRPEGLQSTQISEANAEPLAKANTHIPPASQGQNESIFDSQECFDANECEGPSGINPRWIDASWTNPTLQAMHSFQSTQMGDLIHPEDQKSSLFQAQDINQGKESHCEIHGCISTGHHESAYQHQPQSIHADTLSSTHHLLQTGENPLEHLQIAATIVWVDADLTFVSSHSPDMSPASAPRELTPSVNCSPLNILHRNLSNSSIVTSLPQAKFADASHYLYSDSGAFGEESYGLQPAGADVFDSLNFSLNQLPNSGPYWATEIGSDQYSQQNPSPVHESSLFHHHMNTGLHPKAPVEQSTTSSPLRLFTAGGKRERSHQNTTPTRPENIDKNGHKLKRPMNAYLLFCAEWRERCRIADPFNDTRELATKLGEMWRTLDEPQKREYNRRAEEIKSNFLQENPNYRFTRRKKAKKDSTSMPHSSQEDFESPQDGARKRLFD